MIGSTWLRLAMWLTGITAELAVIYALALSTYKALKEAHLPESVRQRLSVARRALRRIGALGIALTILVGLNIFAICMLKQEPFSTGQTLGWGFLIGWVASLIMFVGVDELTTIGLMPRGSVPDASGSRLRVLHAGALSGALLGWSTGIVLATWMIFRGYPNHALIGVAIGFCFAALATGAPLQYTQYTALTDAIQVHKSGNASRRFQPLQRGWERLCANLLLIRALVCTCIVALTSSLVLAIHHRNLPTASVEILLYPLALMSMLILVWGVATAIMSIVWAWHPTVAITIGALLLSSIYAWLAWRLIAHIDAMVPYAMVVIIGIVTGLLLLCACAGAITAEASSGEQRGGIAVMRIGALCALIAVGMIAAGYALRAGYGVSLSAVGLTMLSVSAIGYLILDAKSCWQSIGECQLHECSDASPNEGDDITASPYIHARAFAHIAIHSMLFANAFVILRLFYERYSHVGSRADLYMPYVLLSLCLGIIVPFAMGSLFVSTVPTAPHEQSADDGNYPRIMMPPIGLITAWLGTIGIGIVAATIVIPAIWGTSASAGYLAGIAGSMLMSCILAGMLLKGTRNAITAMMTAMLNGTALISPLIALSVLQLTTLLAPLSRQPRLWRIKLLAIALGIVACWISLHAIVRWLVERRAHHQR